MENRIEIRLFSIEGAECHRDAKVTFEGGTLEFVKPKMNKKYRFALEIDGDCMASKDGRDFYLADAIQLDGRRIRVNGHLEEKAKSKKGNDGDGAGLKRSSINGRWKADMD